MSSVERDRSAGDLKPCPFCGGRADVVQHGWDIAAVECDDCNATTRTYACDSVEEAESHAVNAWNERLAPRAVSIADIVGMWADDPEPDVDTDPQPAPVARGPEVFPVVLKAIDRYGESSGRDVAPLRALVEQRRAFGLEKYKVTLHRDDGRDPVKDATDEVGDLPGYLMRLLMLEMFDEAEDCLRMLAQVYTLCLEELRAARRRAIERERTQQPRDASS